MPIARVTATAVGMCPAVKFSGRGLLDVPEALAELVSLLPAGQGFPGSIDRSGGISRALMAQVILLPGSKLATLLMPQVVLKHDSGMCGRLHSRAFLR